MAEHRGTLIIADDAVLKGEVENAESIEVHGYVEGRINAGQLAIARGGRLFGEVRAQSADVRGTMQGDVRIKNHIAIRASGAVNGTVKYGKISMEEGAELTAHVRNVPPSISGDLDLAVRRGGHVRITVADLSADDPDDAATELQFSVTNPQNGRVCRASELAAAIDLFTQAELRDGKIAFAHDGSAGDHARFDVVVSDSEGATSGEPRTVKVAIRD